jgi:benzylsuccinate CoA-transferase BbsF subunit
MAAPILQGLRILDLTQVAVGPYATMLLGFMGAQVIKVESCSRMDIARGPARPVPGSNAQHPGGIPGERPWNRAAHHVNRNANKLSLTLDLSAPRGRELFLELAKLCDVLAENYRASVMDRLGLGYEAVSQVNPQLVYLKISSQGASGPEKDYGSLGSTLEHTTGLASITGYEDGIPLGTNETYPDPLVGMLAVGALMAALRQRRRTGKGSFVDLAQREATINILGDTVLDYSYNGRVSGPTGNTDPMMSPHGVYPCTGEDRWVAIAVGSDAQWRGLCRAIGQPSLVDDPKFATLEGRTAHRQELDLLLSRWTQERDHNQAMHLLQAHGVAAGAVLKGIDVIHEPHLQARGFWDTVEHPEAGQYIQVTTPWKLSRDQRQTAVPAPGLGEHNGYVLSELLGLPEGELEDLETQGIIGARPVGA